MQNDEITLSDVRRLRVEPGDALLVSLPYEHVEPEMVTYMRDCFEAALPGTEVLFAMEGIDVAVITPSADVVAAARAVVDHVTHPEGLPPAPGGGAPALASERVLARLRNALGPGADED